MASNKNIPMDSNLRSSQDNEMMNINSSDEELDLIISQSENMSIKEAISRPITPGMSKNVASTLHNIKETSDYQVDDSSNYIEAKINLLPSESHLTSALDFEHHSEDDRRASSKQVFPDVSCLPFENNVVFCFMLSTWDNIIGPQTVYVWKKKTLPNLQNFDDLIAANENKENKENNPNTFKIRQRRRSSLGYGKYVNIRKPSIAEEVTDDKKLTELTFQDGNKEDLNKVSKPDSKQSIWKNINPVVEGKGLSRDQYRSSMKNLEISTYDLTSSSDAAEALPEPKVGVVSTKSKAKSKLDSNRISKSKSVSSIVSDLSDDSSFFMQNSSEKNLSEARFSQNQRNRPTPSLQVYYDSDNSEKSDKWASTNSLESKSKSYTNFGRGHLKVSTVVPYVTEHSVVVSELGRSPSKITSSLLIVPQQSIIIIAARFTVVEDGMGVPFCLSMVIPLEERDCIIPLTEFITNYLLRTAAITRLLITKTGLTGAVSIKGRLIELCNILVALRKASLDQYPLVPAGKPPEDRRLTELLLTSHLQTSGTTLVIADSPNIANKIVMWLGQFSRPEDLHISRLCLSFAQWPYHAGLAVQGVVRSASGEVNLSSKEILASNRPLTVVDMTDGSVRQTLQSLRQSKVDTFRQELLGLWHDLPDVGSTSRNILAPVKKIAPLVHQFLHDFDRLGGCSHEVQQKFIFAFLRSLQYTAYALITWTKQEWIPRRSQLSFPSLRHALMTIFNLEMSDLEIILAQAENLEPGFLSLVLS